MKEKSLAKIDIFVDLFADQFKKLLGTGYDFSKALTLFECIGNLINFSTQVDTTLTAKIEQAISPYLNKIINENQTDLISFVLQIYSIIIRNTNDINKPTYKIIFESLFNPTNWIIDNVSVFPAYIIYMASYIYKIPSIIVDYAS